MELIWFEDYLALAETLNFSRAAELRHVTQPAFSRRIRALEGWVGTALFTRTTHGVTLTSAGEYFHDQAEVLTRALHQLRRDTLEVSDRHVRPLSLRRTHFGKNVNESACVAAIDSGLTCRSETSRVSRRS